MAAADLLDNNGFARTKRWKGFSDGSNHWLRCVFYAIILVPLDCKLYKWLEVRLQAKQREAENEAKVKVAEHKAHDASTSAEAAQAAAKQAEDLAHGIKKQLHDAKCGSSPGCASLQGYCCPTFDVTQYDLAHCHSIPLVPVAKDKHLQKLLHGV